MKGSKGVIQDEGILKNTTESVLSGVNSPYGRLAYMELCVCLSVALLAVLVFFGSFRRRCNNRLLRIAIWTAFSLSYTITAYTVGLMDSAPFRNELLVVWAVFLLLVIGSPDTVSAYSLEDHEQRKRQSWEALVQLFWVVWLLKSYQESTVFYVPLLILLALSAGKMGERNRAFKLADRSTGLAQDSKLIADFMGYEHEFSTVTDPTIMKGYHYLVVGEEKLNLKGKFDPPTYRVRLTNDDITKSSVITTEKIWQCDGRLLKKEEGDPNGRLKDICLSFALFKLLRRRFAGYPLDECKHPKTMNFVLRGLLPSDVGNDNIPDRVFRVIEVELAFLFDFFFTKYPVIFRAGIPKYKIVNFLGVMIGCLIAASTLKNYVPPKESTNHKTQGGAYIDVRVTQLVIYAIIVLELYQIVIILFSDWAKVLLLCKYVEKPSWQQNRRIEKMIGFVCRRHLLKPWERKLGQYSLLLSYDYSPSRFLYAVTLDFIDKPLKGQKASRSIRLSTPVKKAILRSLRSSLNPVRPAGATIVSPHGIQLPNGRLSLETNGAYVLRWACPCSLQTCTHVILVWHIATTLCEIHNINSSSSSSSSNDNRIVATMLSKYCAYLVAFVPALLPGHAYATEHIFSQVVGEARKKLGRKLKSMQKIYKKMEKLSKGETIIEKGAELWGQLKKQGNNERQWKILADFWVELILYMTPSDNVRAHAENLAHGGEFITHLWALLSHAGIINRDSNPHHV